MVNAGGKSRTQTFAVLACILFAANLLRAEEPSKNLQSQAVKIAKEHLAQFGKGYTAKIDTKRHLVYISALDERHLAETMQLLAVYIDAQRKLLLAKELPWNVTIILPTADDYKKFAPHKDVGGFYRYTDKTLIALDRGRVLVHEFTHALHHADCAAVKQEHPVWICEGLATLYEASRLNAGSLEPQICNRLLTLQQAIRTKTTIPLAKLLSMKGDKFTKDIALCYAESRYLMLYLNHLGVLKKWYETYKDTYANDKTGRVAMEKVLGKRIFSIEEDWKKWVASLRLPWGELRSGQARIGLEFKDDKRGAKVIRLVSGGAAEQAGRIKKGDIITHFNGRKVSNAAELINEIRAAGAMQTVVIKLIRNDRKLTVRQPLGAPQTK